jgi:hypothetical protein
MASRKEEKERLRKAREEAERAEAQSQRKRLVLGYIVAGVISAAVLVGIVFAIVGGGDDDPTAGGSTPNINFDFGGILPEGVSVDDREGTEPPPVEISDLQQAARTADCELRTDLPEEGRDHIPPDSDPPDYDTDPPTSGDHAPDWLADGAFADPVPVLNAVHSLEHGRILVQYRPDLGEEAQLALKGVFEADRPGVILFPNPDMEWEVAATAWTHKLGCETYEGAATLDAVRAFVVRYRGQGPEAVPH